MPTQRRSCVDGGCDRGQVRVQLVFCAARVTAPTACSTTCACASLRISFTQTSSPPLPPAPPPTSPSPASLLFRSAPLSYPSTPSSPFPSTQKTSWIATPVSLLIPSLLTYSPHPPNACVNPLRMKRRFRTNYFCRSVISKATDAAKVWSSGAPPLPPITPTPLSPSS